MVSALNLYDATKRKALSSRETARSIKPIVSAIIANGNGDGSLTVDFENTVVVSPSFFDELLRVIQDSPRPGSTDDQIIYLSNTSAHQFRRFRSVCRSHGLSAENIAQNHWRITKA